MLIFRLFIILLALLLAISGGMYIFTRERRYLEFAWQTLRFAIFMLLIFALLYILERYALTSWKVLL